MITLEEAFRIAREAHAEQRDRDGQQHMAHVMTVTDMTEMACTGMDGEDRDACMRVAILHDVMEDADGYEERLRAGLSPTEFEALILLNRKNQNDTYMGYVMHIARAPGRAGEIARTVKEADLTHNLSRCLDHRDSAITRYAYALKALWRAPKP